MLLETSCCKHVAVNMLLSNHTNYRKTENIFKKKIYYRQYVDNSQRSTLQSLYTYIIGQCQDYSLVSHTTYVLCVNFIQELLELQFKNQLRTTDFLINFGNFIYSPSFCQKSTERIAPNKYLFIFHFVRDV